MPFLEKYIKYTFNCPVTDDMQSIYNPFKKLILFFVNEIFSLQEPEKTNRELNIWLILLEIWSPQTRCALVVNDIVVYNVTWFQS